MQGYGIGLLLLLLTHFLLSLSLFVMYTHHTNIYSETNGSPHPRTALETLYNELECYRPGLTSRPAVIVANKAKHSYQKIEVEKERAEKKQKWTEPLCKAFRVILHHLLGPPFHHITHMHMYTQMYLNLHARSCLTPLSTHTHTHTHTQTLSLSPSFIQSRLRSLCDRWIFQHPRLTMKPSRIPSVCLWYPFALAQEKASVTLRGSCVDCWKRLMRQSQSKSSHKRGDVEGNI